MIIIVLSSNYCAVPSDLASYANDSFVLPFDPALLVTRVRTLVGAKKELAH
jgi:hypothetical protein